MTLKQALSHAQNVFTDSNIEDIRLECELLLKHTLKINQVQLYLDLNRELTPKQEKTFRYLVERRLHGEPTAYITGHCEFYGLDFYVNANVLIPRPESELLVEETLCLTRDHAISTIADIGTGCGAIAISLACNLPVAKIYATDISVAALKVAQVNCNKHGVSNSIHLLQCDMLNLLPEPVDLIVTNLPYVRESDLLRTSSVNYEPWLALNGGQDGLQKIRQLCHGLGSKLRRNGCLLLEIGQGHSQAVTSLLNNLFPKSEVKVISDLGGIDRVVSLV